MKSSRSLGLLGSRFGRLTQRPPFMLKARERLLYTKATSKSAAWKPAMFVAATSLVGVAAAANFSACAAKDRQDWPTFHKDEISKHDSPAKGVWIVVGSDVYDLTEFIDSHPGGKDKILLAAGKNVEPFWNIYRQHWTPAVKEIMAPYKIGVVFPDEWNEESRETSILNDPYANDPERSPALNFHSRKPCNAEPPAELVAESYITPNELFFIRNHSPVPDLSEDSFRLVIRGRAGQEDRTFTLAQLKSGFKRLELTSSIQCGGNRRHGLNEVTGKPACYGTDWDAGAIATARFAGVSLREVLDFCGHSHGYCKDQGVEHVIFEGADGVVASIPIAKALCPGECVLLVYEMNGVELPRDHGYPLRVLVPGHVGIRNIKWVTKIACSKEEAEGPWQRGIAYKGFSPSTTSPAGIDVEKIASLQEMPVQSAIVSPRNQTVTKVEEGTIPVRGYAWSGGGRGIIRVDVSIDGGNTWHTAELGEGKDQPRDRSWAWTLWSLDVPVPHGTTTGTKLEVCCRATDASYNVQPESTKSIWNLRGIVNNAMHRVMVKAEIED